jgi:hypothetical protein
VYCFQNSKNKKLPEESSQPISSSSTAVGSPSTQPSERRKTLPPKVDKGKGKVVGGSRDKETEMPIEVSDYEITRRDSGVVYGSDQAFSDLSPKELRVRWRKAMGQLVGNKDLIQLASVPAKTRVNELLALQAEVLNFLLA